MRTLREESAKWSAKKLRHVLLDLNEVMVAFEKYLEQELGVQTFNDLCSGFATQRTAEMMREAGMDEDIIQKFVEEMGHGKRDAEA